MREIGKTTLNFGVSQRTALRDTRLLRQAGVLEVRWDRKRQAFLPVTLEPFPLEGQGNKTRQKYLEKLRRLCLLMRRMSCEDGTDGMSKVELYRELLPGTSDRTRQRDFKELEKLRHGTNRDLRVSRGGGTMRSPAPTVWQPFRA